MSRAAPKAGVLPLHHSPLLSYFTKKIPLSELYNVLMKIVTKKITLKEIDEMAKNMFGNLVKVVIDIDKKIIVVDGELHADEEALLIKNGSEQKNLWGLTFIRKKKKILLNLIR